MNSAKQELERGIRTVKRDYEELEHRMRGQHADVHYELHNKLQDLERSIDRLEREIRKLE